MSCCSDTPLYTNKGLLPLPSLSLHYSFSCGALLWSTLQLYKLYKEYKRAETDGTLLLSLNHLECHWKYLTTCYLLYLGIRKGGETGVARCCAHIQQQSILRERESNAASQPTLFWIFILIDLVLTFAFVILRLLLLSLLSRSNQSSFSSHKCPRLRGERHLRGAELDRAWTQRQGAAHLLRGAGQSRHINIHITTT